MNLNDIIYADPAGNITAIVQNRIWDNLERRELAKEIMRDGKAEQVGFVCRPIQGGDCRLEMMGGEFCGNACRAYGYLCAAQRSSGGRYFINVEISGAKDPVVVNVNLDDHTAFARMPMPHGVYYVPVEEREYPVVRMDGIDHMIITESMREKERKNFTAKAIAALSLWEAEAVGVMFLEEDRLIPVVYVKKTESLVWESSCGSGSVAAAWYLTEYSDPKDGEKIISFREPGGELQVEMTVRDGHVARCSMGGKVDFLPSIL